MGKAPNENKVGALYWIALGLGLSAAFGLPLLEVFWPETVSLIMMGICILAGAASLRKNPRVFSYRSCTRSFSRLDGSDG